MQATLISALLHVLMKILTPELLKEFADNVLDFCRDKVLGSASKVDDALVLPVIKLIRMTFDIDPNDED